MLLGLNRRWWGRCTGYFTGDERAHALSAENQPSQGKSAKASRRGCSCCCCNCKPTPCTSASHAFTGYALLVHPATSLCLPCVVSVSRSGSRSLRLPLYIFFLFILLFLFFRLFFFQCFDSLCQARERKAFTSRRVIDSSLSTRFVSISCIFEACSFSFLCIFNIFSILFYSNLSKGEKCLRENGERLGEEEGKIRENR